MTSTPDLGSVTDPLPALRSLYPSAAYARSCHTLPWSPRDYERALRMRTARAGVAAPVFFEDTDCHAAADSPGLSCLLDLVTAGLFRAVVVPGVFVFDLARVNGADVAERISRGGSRLVEVPLSLP